MSEIAETLARLRETRDALMRPGAPLRVDLRDYVPEGSAAWRAFVRIRSESARSTLVPGHSVRRATMVGWLEEVIARLEVETAAGETPTDEPAEEVEAPSPRDVPQAGERSSSMEAPAPSGTPLRRLTAEGIAEAQAFLARLREHPDGDRTPPDELLFGDRYSRPFDASAGITVEPRAFGTRREAGEYLSPLLAPVRHRILIDAGVWSWLGMYYFADTVRVKDGRVQLHTDEASLFLGERAAQRRYRHYLWMAWRIYEQYDESVSFLLDQPLAAGGDLLEAIGGYARIFNSAGIVPLTLRLYTHGSKLKRGFSAKRGHPGNIRRLPAMLDQLALTYDVYGMEPDALLDVLPDDFRAWAGRTN